ncbi:hypothetical protein MKW92_033640 [Papaver armeniacum]|nr:hypothetical protein MKW92_033640 [Papaver armeniacum]
MASSSLCSSTHKYLIILLLVFSISFQKVKNCNALQTFGFEVHHRFSDKVKSIMGSDNLPEIGSREYHAAMAHRDKLIHGRALAENDGDDPKVLTLSNITKPYGEIGSLHYANISLGTPGLSFLVALDAGTKLLWVPCVENVMSSTPGAEINFNIYSIHSSQTSKYVFCNNSLCNQSQSACIDDSSSRCPYSVVYNNGSKSSGILVEDVLRLKTSNHKAKDIDPRITFGCGQLQTGLYLDGAASNGLFGLGIGDSSVPSILSSKGLIADSFSMCFGYDGVGRITFGDRRIPDQNQTTINYVQKNPNYNISVTQLSVGGNLSNLLNITAIYYSGSEYTYLNDPAYTALCERFDSQIDKRHSAGPTLGFEYCYDVSTDIPSVTLIMKGGSQFSVYNPMVPINNDDERVTAYCLGVFKTSGSNFIGNNFMTGHNIVLDREKLVMGWKPSNNCTAEIVDPNAQLNIPQNPTFGNGGTPKNGLNSNKAPQYLVVKP